MAAAASGLSTPSSTTAARYISRLALMAGLRIRAMLLTTRS